ncbi:MAG: pyridoxamine 5'-phosphate oxidase family protein [Pirellulaceae bacterium]
MAKFFEAITDKLGEFIAAQHVFFVATAAEDGRINLSPKGYDALRVLGPKRLIWLNLSGSGNETAAHVRAVNRMTLMFCAFEGAPLILRIYGSAKTIHPRDEEWSQLYKHFDDYSGARQIFDLQVESLQTSCGFGVPLYEFAGERSKLIEHSDAKGREIIEKGWAEKNATSIDGLETGILD